VKNKKLIAAAKAALFIFLASANFVFAQNVDDFFEKFSGVKTVESDFVMKKYVSISETPFESSGKFYFKNPDFLSWDYIKPFSYGFTIDKDKTVIRQNNDGKYEEKDVSSQSFAKALSQQLYAFVSMNKEIISKTYDAELFDEGIILRPKNKNERQLIENIKIYFPKESKAAEKVMILNKTGDRTEILFSNTKTTQ
jgi:outer membrane lipoprotein carrier protein